MLYKSVMQSEQIWVVGTLILGVNFVVLWVRNSESSDRTIDCSVVLILNSDVVLTWEHVLWASLRLSESVSRTLRNSIGIAHFEIKKNQNTGRRTDVRPKGTLWSYNRRRTHGVCTSAAPQSMLWHCSFYASCCERHVPSIHPTKCSNRCILSWKTRYVPPDVFILHVIYIERLRCDVTNTCRFHVSMLLYSFSQLNGFEILYS